MFTTPCNLKQLDIPGKKRSILFLTLLIFLKTRNSGLKGPSEIHILHSAVLLVFSLAYR